MGANMSVDIIRTFLGEQSSAVWSDNDLRNYMSLANLTIWKILCDQAPSLVTYPYTFKVGGSGDSIQLMEDVDTVLPGQIIDADSGSGTGAMVASVLAVYEAKYPAGSNPSFKKLKIKTGQGPYPTLENSNSLFDDLEIPNIYQERMAIFDYGTQSLTIHPAPGTAKTYIVELITETPVYILAGDSTKRTALIVDSSSDESNLLGSERFDNQSTVSIAFHAQQAVIYEAAYQASFVDKSMRREFAAERDRLIAITSTPPPLSIDEAY